MVSSCSQNSFSVSDGQITLADLNVEAYDYLAQLIITYSPGDEPSDLIVAPDDEVSGVVTFTPVSTTSIAPSASLFATGLALLGFLRFWRKARLTIDHKDARRFA